MKTKTILTILAAAALISAAGCNTAPAKKAAPIDPVNSYRNLCQTVLAETINAAGGVLPAEDTSRKITKDCATTANSHAGGESTTPEQEQVYSKNILTACKEYAGKGQPWLDCYKKQISK